MDLEPKDPDTLKLNTLQLLISYPNGIKFGDFIGVFYQFHHFHPQLSHYGYNSLRHLLNDMRETVVVEGSQSNEPVMKLVNGLNLDGWIDEILGNELDSFEEEDSRLKEEERTRRETTANTAETDLAEVLAAVTNLLTEYESGLKLEKMQSLLLSTNGIDLKTFSITKGYKDVLTFLSDQIPNLTIRRRGTLNRYVVQLSKETSLILEKDLTVASVPICSILKLYPDGLKLAKLKEAVKKKCGYDLDIFCYQIGYKDVVSCLQEIPELIIYKNKNRNVRVQLKSAFFCCSSSQSSHSPSFDSEQSTCKSKNVNQGASEKKPVLSEIMALLTALLRKYMNGLRVKKLQDFLLTDEGIDLEKFSIAQGYKDTVEFLEQKMPQMLLTYQANRVNTIIIEPHSVLSKVMASLTAFLSRYTLGLRVNKLEDLLLTKEGIDLEKFSIALGYKDTVEFLEQKMPEFILHYRKNRLDTVVIQPHSETDDSLNTAPAPFSCSSYRSSYSSSDTEYSTSTSNNSNQDESEKRPVLSDVMALISALLSNYKKGLRIWKLQEFLLADEGINLEKFSIAHGYKDTVEFLEQKMTQLILNYQVNRLDTVVINPHSDLEDISKPASAISDLSASDPPEVNNLFHTNQSGPFTTSSNLPSFHEPHNNISVKTKSSPLFSNVVQSQQPNPCQLSAKSVTEQIASNSHVTTFQPSTVQDELKQQVARILARHPKGLSLFQFRIAYSATFKQQFPVGNASSIKQRLLEMPDVVYMKGHGVQTLLLPVSPDVSSAKPGEPASSKVENVAAVSSLALVHPVPVTKPAVKTFDSRSVWTSPLDSPEKPGSKDCCISKDQSVLLAPCQEQEKVRTNLPSFSKEDVPVIPGHSLPRDESLIIPQYFLAPAAPRAAMMPVPKPHHSLQYYQSIRRLENEGNKPFTEHHTQGNPGSVKIMQTNTSHLNDSGPKLREKPTIPHCSAALPTHSQDTVCGENLQTGIKSRFTSSTNSKVYVPAVDSTPVAPVLVKPEIYSPRSTSHSSDSIQPMLPVQPSPHILSIKQRTYNGAIVESDSLSEAQIQSRALQHSLSPDSSAKSSVSSLPRNSTSCFPSRSQLDDQLQQPTHARHSDLQSISVSLADKSLRKASLDRVSPVAMYRRKSTYANSLETSSTTEAFIACSVSGSLHTSVIVSNSRASSSVSSRAVSPAFSPLDFTAKSYDQIAYASAEITSNSSALFSETQVYAQQREYDRAAATVISNTETSSTSLLLESTTSSHHQFAYASTNSSAQSSETYAFTHQRQNTQASETIIASSTETTSSISSLDSTTGSLPCQHAHASAEATSNSSVLSKSTACHTPNTDFKTNPDPSGQNNLTSSLSKQGNQSASLGKKKVSLFSRIYDGCLVL